MRKGRFSEEQMVAIIREGDRDPMAAVAKRHGISEQTIYTWRKRFGALKANDVKRLRQLEAENARLKKLVAERDLEIEVMKEVAAKNVWSAPSVQGSRKPDVDSPLKCIRPLASGLLLQPGHDEIRAYRSQIMVRAQGTVFCQSLRHADRLPRHPPRASQSLARPF